VGEDVQARFGGSTSSSALFVEIIENASLSPPKKVLFPLRKCELREKPLIEL